MDPIWNDWRDPDNDSLFTSWPVNGAIGDDDDLFPILGNFNEPAASAFPYRADGTSPYTAALGYNQTHAVSDPTADVTSTHQLDLGAVCHQLAQFATTFQSMEK